MVNVTYHRGYITTSLEPGELAEFNAIAARNNVTPSAYLRAIVIDVINEEREKEPNTNVSL